MNPEEDGSLYGVVNKDAAAAAATATSDRRCRHQRCGAMLRQHGERRGSEARQQVVLRNSTTSCSVYLTIIQMAKKKTVFEAMPASKGIWRYIERGKGRKGEGGRPVVQLRFGIGTGARLPNASRRTAP